MSILIFFSKMWNQVSSLVGWSNIACPRAATACQWGGQGLWPASAGPWPTPLPTSSPPSCPPPCKKSQQGPALRSRLKAIHTELVDSVHCWAALCFLNQLLVNKFYSETLKHPFFQKLTLPLSLEEAIRDANANTMQGWNRILVPCFSLQGQLLSL